MSEKEYLTSEMKERLREVTAIAREDPNAISTRPGWKRYQEWVASERKRQAAKKPPRDDVPALFLGGE